MGDVLFFYDEWFKVVFFCIFNGEIFKVIFDFFCMNLLKDL